MFVCVENDFESDDDVLTAGLSIVFLKFTCTGAGAGAPSRIVVNITKEYTDPDLNINHTEEIQPNIYLPDKVYGYLPTSLVRSYPQQVCRLFMMRIFLVTSWLWIISGRERKRSENKSYDDSDRLEPFQPALFHCDLVHGWKTKPSQTRMSRIFIVSSTLKLYIY